jgi:hypothetical protein
VYVMQVASIGNNITVQIAASISAKVSAACSYALHASAVRLATMVQPCKSEEDATPHQVTAQPSVHSALCCCPALTFCFDRPQSIYKLYDPNGSMTLQHFIIIFGAVQVLPHPIAPVLLCCHPEARVLCAAALLTMAALDLASAPGIFADALPAVCSAAAPLAAADHPQPARPEPAVYGLHGRLLHHLRRHEHQEWCA